jgi:hypothetical protein
MLEFPMRRVGHTLVLTSPAYEEDFLRIPENQDLIVPRPRRNRSLQQNNFLHAVLSELLKGGVFDGSMPQFKDFLKLKMNWGKWYPSSDGNAIFVPDHQPDEKQEYTGYIERMMDAIVQHTGIDPNALEEMCNTKKREETKMGFQPSPAKTELETRLWAFAAKLDYDSTADLMDKWIEVRREEDTRDLYRTTPLATENIVVAARAHARGRFSRQQFNDEVEKIIQEAVKPLG